MAAVDAFEFGERQKSSGAWTSLWENIEMGVLFRDGDSLMVDDQRAGRWVRKGESQEAQWQRVTASAESGVVDGGPVGTLSAVCSMARSGAPPLARALCPSLLCSPVACEWDFARRKDRIGA